MVATMVVLFETDEPEASLDASTLGELSELGVTNLALVRDERTVGIVLEGWAFDPAISAGAALSTLAGDGSGVRALYPVGEMAVSAAQRKGALEPEVSRDDVMSE
jgi:hypothetical protein